MLKAIKKILGKKKTKDYQCAQALCKFENDKSGECCGQPLEKTKDETKKGGCC